MAEFIGNTIIKLAQVDSTNNYATAHMTINNWSEGTVVITEEQFKGRGQINNSWESEAGKNILLSIVLQPEFLPVQHQFLISKVVAISVWETLSLLVNCVAIKWPNDIYVDQQKIAGILIENAIMGSTLFSSVVGIGLNVNQLIFKSDAPNPVSLAQLLKVETDRDQLLSKLLEFMNKWYSKLKNGSIDEINRTYENYLFRKGEEADYKDATGIYRGVVLGVNEIGQLLIQPLNDEVRSYHFKEVEFLF